MAEIQLNEELIVGLYDREVLKFSDFEWTLKSKRKSPLYYNQRILTSYDPANDLNIDQQMKVREMAVNAYAAAVDRIEHPERHQHLYGLPQAMTALGAMVAAVRGESYLWGRVGDKGYGVHSKIEGNYETGDFVVALDDVITDAGSKIEAAEALDQSQLNTRGFVIMFDRQEGGAQTLRTAGHELVAVIGLAHAMDVLRTEGRIGTQEFDWVAQYHQNLRDEGVL